MPRRLSSLAARFAKAVGGDSADPATPTAAAIQAQITAAQAELDGLTAAHPAVAFDAISGDPEAGEREDALAEQITGLETLLRRLNAALTVARQREEEAALQLRLQAQADLRKRVAAKFNRRSRYTAELTEAIGAAVKAFQHLHRINTEILACYPYGSETAGLHLHNGELLAIVSHELYRQGGTPMRFGGDPTYAQPNFPGGQPPDVDYRDQPERITPLAKVIEDANAYAVALMEQGKSALTEPVAEAEGETTNE